MIKYISVKTASDTKSYKLSQQGSYFYCMKYNKSFFGSSWSDIGHARSFEDALNIIKSHALSKYGKVSSVNIE